MPPSPPVRIICSRRALAPSERRNVCPGLLLWLIVFSVLSSGCSRPFWRTQADFDAYNLLMEKTSDERWDVPRLTLESDPRSRIYDPYDPDLEPLPPDDPAANQFMYYVDGMRGYKSWHRFGQQMSLENPQWLAQFDTAERDFAVEWIDEAEQAAGYEPPNVPTINNLTLEQAIELANINSREYQLQLENTYQSALALTFARFQFNVRYLGFGGQQPTSSLNYINQPSTLDTLNANNRFGISQLLPTGGQWIAEVANNTLWLFSTPGRTNSASLLSYSLVQPLLAGAGRKVVLENLTLTERQVLYDLRALARFRQTFFSTLVASNGGYLGLMQQVQQVDNLRSNLREYRLQLEKLREINTNPRRTSEERLAVWPDGLVIPEDLSERLSYDPVRKIVRWRGELTLDDEERLVGLSEDPAYQKAIRALGATYRIEIFTQDISQVLNTATNTELQLRSAEAGLLDAIDNYKLVLGLPTDFQITLDRSLLEPFQLIDPQLRRVEDALQRSITTWMNRDGSDPTQPQLAAIAEQLDVLLRRVDQQGLDLVAEDLDRELANRPERLRRLTEESLRDQVLRNVERDRILFQRNQDEHAALQAVLDELRTLLTEYELPLEHPPEGTPVEPLDKRVYPNVLEYTKWPGVPTVDDFLGALLAMREDMLQIVQGLKVVQVGSRSELITLQEFDMSLEDAVALAIENRLDLMNVRAQVMDARRNLEVAANRMQGVLNVVTRGDVRNTGGTNPFDFRADESTFQFGLQFTAPLDQVLVRNNYRNALIEYQQARRAYMQLEDTIKAAVRSEWRQLQLLKANFETSRQNIRYAAINLDVTVENVYAPSSATVSAIPQVGGGLRQQNQNSGLNLINALSGILNAQNNLIGIWVGYERNRINIFRDMGIMEVDERGLWRDPAYQFASEALPPDLSEPADVNDPPPAADVERHRPAFLPDESGADDEGAAIVVPVSARKTHLGPGRGARAGVRRLADDSDSPLLAP